MDLCKFKRIFVSNILPFLRPNEAPSTKSRQKENKIKMEKMENKN
jgi:hypothetical protein